MSAASAEVPPLQEIVRLAIAKTARLDPAEVTPELRLDELGLDSLRLTAVVARIEVACGVEFNSDQMLAFLKCECISDFVSSVANVITSDCNTSGVGR